MGHAFRRTYKTIAANISAAPLGHVPAGMPQKYLIRWARISGPAIIKAQATISKTIMQLLKAKPPLTSKKRAA
jgi:hypothetical protein